MIVNIHAGKRTDINTVFAFVGKRIGGLIVQAVNPFNNQYIFRTQGLIISLVLAHSRFKIEAGKFYGFTGKQIAHILIKFFNVNSLQTFKIVVAFFILGSLLPVYKIIIQRDRMGIHSLCFKLYGKTVGKSRFSGGGRSCNHDKFNAAPPCNILGDLSDLSFLLRFLYQYQLIQVAAADHIIQIADRFDIYFTAPVRRFFQRCKQLLPGSKRRNFLRRFLFRQQKHNSLIIGNQPEIPDISRMGKHISIVIIKVTVHLVNINIGASPVTEKFYLILHALSFKQLHRF